MITLPKKFCGSPLYLQMHSDLSFSCYCPFETGLSPCNLHPYDEFHTSNIDEIINHMLEHIAADDDVVAVTGELRAFKSEWKKLVEQKGKMK